MSARQNLADTQGRLSALRSRVAELWGQAEAGAEVDITELATAEQTAEVLERALPRLNEAAAAEQEAEQVDAWDTRAAAELETYRDNSTALAIAVHDADAAMANLAEVADAHRRHLAAYAMAPRPRSVLATMHTSDRSARLWAGGQMMHEIEPADVLLAVVGKALASLPGNPWPQYVAEFTRIRRDLHFVVPAQLAEETTP